MVGGDKIWHEINSPSWLFLAYIMVEIDKWDERNQSIWKQNKTEMIFLVLETWEREKEDDDDELLIDISYYYYSFKKLKENMINYLRERLREKTHL